MNPTHRAGDHRLNEGLGRRSFILGAAAAVSVAVAGCASSSDGSTPAALSGATAAALGPRPFGLGVASGDPTSEAVILWTRLAPDPTAADATGGLGAVVDEVVEVAWEVAADADMDETVARGVAEARPEFAHSVHVDVAGLEAGTAYWYRFTVGEAASAVGRTATLPAGTPDRFGLAVVNCQMFESGAYGAYRHLVDEPNIDLVLHLGDYIYEYPGGSGEGRHSKPDRLLETLEDYRLRYASYKADPDLQAAHARHPFVLTWDDHEVANNYMGDTAPGDVDPATVAALRQVAYQAWWEHLPVRLDPPEDGILAVHHHVDVGDLARLYVLDERQFSALPPCRDDESTGLDIGDCAEVEGEDRTRLGEDQEAWLADALATSAARWNLLGNPVVLAGVNAGTDVDAYYLDTWDGFPAARRRLIDQLAAVGNPVVLTGDYHAGMVLEVRTEPFDQSSDLVATEFMAPPISSALFPEDVSARTPQLREQLNAHGYLAVQVTPDDLTATFRTLDDVTDPDTGIATASTWVVRSGDPDAQQV